MKLKVYAKRKLMITVCCIFGLALTHAQEWEQMASYLINGRHHPATFAIGNYGYVALGSNFDDVLRYDYAQDTWERLNDFPAGGRGFVIGLEVNGKGYVGFGSNQNTLFNDLWEFDPETEEWTELASCPCDARNHPAFIAIDGKIYIGLGSSNREYNDWWEYDIERDVWTQKAGFPGTVRHHPFQFAVGEYGYVGFGHSSTHNAIYNDFYRYDPTSDSWTQMNDFPGEARVAGTQFHNGEYGYVLSGDGEDHTFMDTGEFWRYDPPTDTWDQLTDHPGISRWAPGSFVIDNKVFLTSGWDPFNGEYNDMWMFPLEINTSVPEIDNTGIDVQPNPANEYVDVVWENNFPNNARIELLDTQGRQIIIGELAGNNRIFLDEVKVTGLYTLLVRENERTAVFKVTVIR